MEYAADDGNEDNGRVMMLTSQFANLTLFDAVTDHMPSAIILHEISVVIAKSASNLSFVFRFNQLSVKRLYIIYWMT